MRDFKSINWYIVFIMNQKQTMNRLNGKKKHTSSKFGSAGKGLNVKQCFNQCHKGYLNICKLQEHS